MEEAVEQGARLLAGGRVNPSPNCLGGFMEPTLLVDVTPDMSIAKHEVFGPVMVMLRAKDDDDAVRIVSGGRGEIGVEGVPRCLFWWSLALFLISSGMSLMNPLFTIPAKANSVEYGLGSSVFSKDYARAERIAARLVTGMCNVNDYGVNYLCQSLPFGGVNVRLIRATRAARRRPGG